MSTGALDNSSKQIHTTPPMNSGAMNVIQLLEHPLWKAREYERLLAFLGLKQAEDGSIKQVECKPDSYWYSVFNKYEGEDHVEAGKAWQRSMIESGAFTPERILEQAKNIAPWVLLLDRMKNPPRLPTWLTA